MPGIDVSKFKHELSAASERRPQYSAARASRSGLAKKAAHRRAIGQLLQPSLTKAGIDLSKLNETLAEQQTALRRLFQEEKAEAAKHAAADLAALHGAIDLGRRAFEQLPKLPGFGGLSSLVSLPAPFLVWEWPHATPDQLRDYKIQPFQSFAKILVDIPAYAFDDDSGSDWREFSFYFFWENASDFVAVANCFSVLLLNGACEVAANAGIFSGDTMSLSIDAWLYPIAYWLPLSPGQNITALRMRGDPLQHQSVLSLSATGGHIFGDAAYANRIFTNQNVGLSFQGASGIQIPARKTAVFEVNLTIGYSWDGNTLPDEIIADFANDNMKSSVECPIVVLQLLTAPPMSNVSS